MGTGQWALGVWFTQEAEKGRLRLWKDARQEHSRPFIEACMANFWPLTAGHQSYFLNIVLILGHKSGSKIRVFCFSVVD